MKLGLVVVANGHMPLMPELRGEREREREESGGEQISVGSETARDTQRNPVLKNQKGKKSEVKLR